MQNQTYTLLSLKEAQAAFESLNAAIVEHTKWLVHWNKYIICNMPISEKDLIDCSVDYCGFSQWLYSDDANFLHDLAIFPQVEYLHHQVHLRVDELLKNAAQGVSVSQQQFDVYIDVEKEFSKYLIDLRDELYRLIFSYDYLTSTLTRQAIFHVLYMEHARVNRSAEQSCIVLIDLDHFKKINDLHGHQVGDEVLRAVTEYFNKHLRPYDSIGRFGGEEFLVCLPDISLENASITMDRLRENLSQQKICTEQGECISLTVSMGIAPLLLGEKVKTVIEHADAALYRAKSRGRNRVEIWSGDDPYLDTHNKHKLKSIA